MDANNSLLSLLLSRQFDPSATGGHPTFDCRQIFRVYVVRQINLLQWISLIFITIVLLKQLARAFDLRRKGNPISGPPPPLFSPSVVTLRSSLGMIPKSISLVRLQTDSSADPTP